MNADLAAFLRDRLDERAAKAEAAARDAGESEWSAGDEYMSDSVTTVERASPVACGPWDCDLSWELRRFIADNDPAWVLAEIDAKRRTLVRCEEAMLSASPLLVHFAEQTLREMALPYADHPDYRAVRL